MWILVFYIAMSVGGAEKAYPLERFSTLQECQQMQAIVTEGMANAYADEPLVWRLLCLPAK